MPHHARPPPEWEQPKLHNKEDLMTRTHPPRRRRLLLLFCALLLFGAVFTVSARAANKITVSTTKCSYQRSPGHFGARLPQ